MNTKNKSKVDLTRGPVVIPTYTLQEADKNPVFYEKRAYQGANGKVYPLPVTDKLNHEKVNKEYDSVTLENEYIQIMVLPEIGGRIHIGLDKTNNYDFIYNNRVIKPALIGVGGPWISGGIEFNWPQHHRPTTFMPLETVLEENADGSKTVWVGEVEPLYRTKAMTGVTVCPGRSYLKVKVRAYNRTPYPQQFMWWANLGVPVNENYKIVFPPDVKYTAFHDRAFISEWPPKDLTGEDGSDGTWFKNHLGSCSYMVPDGSSRFNFIEGYDMGKEAGIVHVGNHHISPGKKLFTWGNGEFAEAWMRNLTDNDGHYVELMTGMYTDNQPDFSWMQPNETRTFEHFWYPVRKIGIVKNATEDAAVSLEVKGEEIVLGYYTTGYYAGSTIVLKAGDEVLLEQKLDIDPANPYVVSVRKPEGIEDYRLWTAIYSGCGRELVSYRPLKEEPVTLPEPRKPSPEPGDIKENEELYLHGLHVEQYRHHALDETDYYMEALRRDPGDIRCNNAMGLSHLKKGMFESAEMYFLKAKERLLSRNTNPYDGEPLYNLGLVRKYLGKYEAAYNDFYKAAWNYAWKSPAYHSLAELDCRKGDFKTALFHINQSLTTNVESIRSRDLKAAILRHGDFLDEAEKVAQETMGLDLLDYWARFELYFTAIGKGNKEEAVRIQNKLSEMMIGKAEAYIDIAIEYAGAGMIDEAMQVLQAYVDTCEAGRVFPMVYCYMGALSSQCGDEDKAAEYCRKAEAMSSDYCFPSRLESIAVLKHAQKVNPRGSKSWYYLGNLFYDKMRYDQTIENWEKSRELDESFSIVHRNLAIAYFEKRKDIRKARISMEKALTLNSSDSRLLYELLQLYKNSNEVSVEDRLRLLEEHESLIEERNDMYHEVLMLLLQRGKFEEAARKMAGHVFDIYEGGEGKVVKIHDWLYILKGLAALEKGEAESALQEILGAAVLPEHYNEGRQPAASPSHVYYYAGQAADAAGQGERAIEYYKTASVFTGLVSDTTFYQGLAYRKLGMEEDARKAFEKLVKEGDTLVEKGARYDFFATNVPTYPPFENNREKLNMSEGLYLRALGYFGLGQQEKGREELAKVLEWNSNHLGAWIHSGKSGMALKL
jgi:tetratricopeptide (TPR) repeat protein